MGRGIDRRPPMPPSRGAAIPLARTMHYSHPMTMKPGSEAVVVIDGRQVTAGTVHTIGDYWIGVLEPDGRVWEWPAQTVRAAA